MLPDMNLRASGGDESQRIGDDGINNKPSSEYVDNSAISKYELKRKRYHRHTPQQIQEMEAFFKQCPHPNNNQRKELSEKLGLEPLQVKFWFQNKRTQLKIDDLAAIVAELVGKPLVDDATIPSSTASPTTDIEVVRRIKGQHKIEE
ncbi:UNVERIFIED_CONTAM: Homeobox-leucine zipper protein ROC2 [Sesamum angustifolium]|uniref:Homeobox-leucine zipper protein ROC2 n=1 Tax=Sesamum angustifolium TaxID=2727405 RepID=A0AAW2PHM7_9LAMI